ncbi:protein BCCIP homolog [Pomacea canaliculata]|uniref:protein BCCIP homolog n=1 Tax=Pomacea canaliculata TaxID=400727 RepID=UPI000D730000|nr:protein BCCIP homolog [Pomacea canaliculata]
MASSRKKRVVDETASDCDEVAEDMSDEDTDESENEFMNQEVQVEFEACMPQDSDFAGIKTLLRQLFLKANVNLSELADMIISQNYVGSVIKQIDAEEEDDSSMDDDSGDTVFGLVTIINLADKKDKDCIQKIISMLTSKSKSVSPQDGQKIEELFSNPNETVGLLINERFINIPYQITLPAMQSLRKDIEKANKKQMPFTFTKILLLCKTYRYKIEDKGQVPSLFFSNPEEEFLVEMSDLSVTWSVASERDGVSEKKWDEDDMEATRTVLVLGVDKLDSFIERLKSELAQ